VDSEHASLTLAGGYRWLENEALAFVLSAEDMERFVGIGDAPFVGGPVVEQSEVFAAADGAIDIGQDHTINAGLSFRRPKFEKLRNQNNFESFEFIEAVVLRQPRPVTFYGDVVETADFASPQLSREILGIYAQDRYEISEQMKLTAGVRVDHYADFGWTVNPRLGLVYAPGVDTTLKFMYGEAFRAPTVIELWTVGPSSFGNPDLKPERVRTAELAWLQNFDHLQTIVTGYVSSIEDRIDGAPAPGEDMRTTFVNGGSEDLTGIELEAHADITPDLFLRGTYSHLFDIAAPPSRASRDLASIVLNYTHDDWNFNVNGYYHGKVEATNADEEDLPPYWMLNGNIRYDLGRITIVGSAYNLLDEDAHVVTQAPIPDGVPSRGRAFRVGLEVEF
jgi:iron complex outermembrane receptor protein